jgi:hypothetical protein
LNQKVYLNILSKEQKDILPILKHFYKDYVLVGGTAIALLLGHRESIDFDLFTFKNKNQFKTFDEIQKINNFPISKLRELKDQSHFILNGVKITFFNYPYKIDSSTIIEKIKMPDLLTLAAMKAFALGRRAKWKDYVDLYFILNSGISLIEIINKTKLLFNSETSTVFNDRIFLEQLTYYEDVSYEEDVIYLTDNPPTDDKIKLNLKKNVFDYLNNNS